MENLKIIVTIIISLFLMTETYSQGNASIQFGTSIPLSDFASDSEENENALGASTGFSTGFQYTYKFSQIGFGVFGEFDLNYNWLQHDYRYKIKEAFREQNIDINIKYYKYINIPLTAGLSYTNSSDSKIGVFAKVGFAYNFFQITEMKIEFDGITIIQDMKLGNSTAFKIGGGIIINKKTSISIDYLESSEYEIAGQIKLSGYKQDITFKGKIDLLTLTCGFLF